jgi:GntR family transcriptional repressor for pyruvate dehydrogenase complex
MTRSGHSTQKTSDIRQLGGGKVAERVVEELRAFISANELRPGDKLPPERVFLEQFGVSRSSLREAIRVLSTVGLIDVRHGDGMYVAAEPEDLNASPGALFDATEEHALRNLVETRLGIELAAATAATERASEEDLARIQQLVDDQGRHIGDPGYAWEPLGFELAVVEITGNSWLYEVELALRDAWLSLSRGLRSSVGRYEEWHAEHRAILASIRSGNTRQVQRLVIAHLSLERFEEDLRSSRKGASASSKSPTAKRRRQSPKGRKTL